MDALHLLLTRRSVGKLTAPAPQGQVLDNILKAGLRAPDHGHLTPWRFVIAQGEGLNTLAQILVKAEQNKNSDEVSVQRAQQAPFRAPMVITVIAKVTAHDKVPAFEQHLSAACALHAMQMAAVAQGFQGIWRSGAWMFDESVAKAFQLANEDHIVGFLYLGTSEITPTPAPEPNLSDFVTYL